MRPSVGHVCPIWDTQLARLAGPRLPGEADRLLCTVLQGFYQSHQASAAAPHSRMFSAVGWPFICSTRLGPAEHAADQLKLFTSPRCEARSALDIFLDYARRMDFRGKDGAPFPPWRDAESAFRGVETGLRGPVL
jgi:hypothetical protein